VTRLPHRRSYADDLGLCDRVFDLLVTWIPALRPMRDRAERLRWRWQDVSTPFVHERDGRVISHVGVLEQTWTLGGVERRMGGIHAVCTLASERRQGLYRILMEEVLAHCDARYPTVELSTEHPEYYEPFGFRRVPEHRFRAPVDWRGGGRGFRPMDLSGPDAGLLVRLLEARAPVSRSFGVVRESAVFKFNQGSGANLHYCEALDLVAVMSRRDDGTLELYDLVARELPSLAALLARIDEPVREVLFHFNPEHLEAGATPEPTSGEDVLMVRGEFPFGGPEIPLGMIPPPARH
jgi:GNAT superfamily N-acetyltransferase